jgi:hypothetical protein
VLLLLLLPLLLLLLLLNPGTAWEGFPPGQINPAGHTAAAVMALLAADSDVA